MNEVLEGCEKVWATRQEGSRASQALPGGRLVGIAPVLKTVRRIEANARPTLLSPGQDGLRLCRAVSPEGSLVEPVRPIDRP